MILLIIYSTLALNCLLITIFLGANINEFHKHFKKCESVWRSTLSALLREDYLRAKKDYYLILVGSFTFLMLALFFLSIVFDLANKI